MKIGIAGLGILGSTIYNTLRSKHEVTVYDPPKKLFGDLWECDVVFICVPVDNKSGKQDLSNVVDVLKKTNPMSAIFLRSTVLPGTTDKLKKKYKRIMWAMPEFLTERRAAEDFHNLPILTGGGWIVLGDLFPGKEMLIMSNVEAELSKYGHNVLGTMKVFTANLIHRQVMKFKANKDKVKDGILMSKLINDVHIDCPGPDGKKGFAGKCFPKDLKAFSFLFSGEERKLLESVLRINLKHRYNRKRR